MIAEFAALIFVVVFLMLTIFKELNYFPSFWKKIALCSHFIPSWSFFAPNPYQSDYYLLARGITPNGEVLTWKQINRLAKKRPFRTAFWNPEKMFVKIFVDMAIDLLNIAKEFDDKHEICLSMPYLHFLNYSKHFVKSDNAKLQFMLMTKCHGKEVEIVFVSEVHPMRN